jgi:limonene-1,2-epoxide hydrolase
MDFSAITTDFAAMWGRGDIDAIVDSFTPDATYHNIPMEPCVGAEAIRSFLEGFFGMSESITFENHHQAVVGNVVLNERTDTIVMGDKTTALRVMGVFEFNDAGKITSWRDYFDMAQFSA